MMDKQALEELIEEAIQYGYIDYDDIGYVNLYYGDVEIRLSTFIDEDVFIINHKLKKHRFLISKEVYDKLNSIFNAWEAI